MTATCAGTPRLAAVVPALASLAVVVVLIAGCGTTSRDDPPGDQAVTQTDGNSHLDRDGIAAIEASGRARFDARDLVITRDDVALQDGRLGPAVGRAGGRDLAVEVVGPSGEEQITTQTFSLAFAAPADRAGYLTWFESYDTESQAFAALEDAVERWGLPPDGVENWRQTLARGGEQDISLPSGVSPSGFVTQVTVRGEAGAGQTHRWTLSLDPRLYEPAALEQIRRTGQAPFFD